MKVLMIGSDRNLFNKNSYVRKRMIRYGELFNELHVIVFSYKNNGFKKQKISNNVWIYPTNSRSKIGHIVNSFMLGKNIISNSESRWIISTQDPFESGIVGWLIKKTYSDAKLQMQIHTDFLSPYFKKESFANNIRVRIAKYLLPKADCVRVVSDRIYESIKNSKIKLKKPPYILPIYIDIKNNHNNDINLKKMYPNFSKIILMMSRQTKEKKIEKGIYAFKEVLKTYPGAGLVIVGDGPEHKKLVSLIEKLNLKKSVVFLPWQEETQAIYKSADLFLVTSSYEGYGMTVVEALSLGLPVVSTDVGIAKNAGAFICDDSPYSISREIIRVFNENKKGSLALKKEYDSFEDYLKKFKESFELCK